MGQGNDGSGWSMSVWPRYVDRTGQDDPEPREVRPARTFRMKNKEPVELDEQKFEAALSAAIGPKAAKAYIRRERRRRAQSSARKPETP